MARTSNQVRSGKRTRKNPAAAVLVRAIQHEVGENTVEIAKGLISAAVKGNATAARIVLEIASDAVALDQEEDGSQGSRLLLDALENEPQYPGMLCEETADHFRRGREPEF